MDQRNIQQEFKDQFQDVVSRLQSKHFFQSDWDIASFAIFFIFIGMVLLMVILVLIRCCCCCCCDEGKPRKRKVGAANHAFETELH
ncbi:small integral membrane protein 22 [Thunnus thynnus]|uniref:small integral membrane protein 22 n=1 Tax=Thunnus thynnus TaxID=8237 RepID=UPI0035286AB6|eukprot:superscaffoldBa00002097_g13163